MDGSAVYVDEGEWLGEVGREDEQYLGSFAYGESQTRSIFTHQLQTSGSGELQATYNFI